MEQLNLSFMKINKIDHLTLLTNLRFLSLRSNLIKRIQNLESCKFIEELLK